MEICHSGFKHSHSSEISLRVCKDTPLTDDWLLYDARTLTLLQLLTGRSIPISHL